MTVIQQEENSRCKLLEAAGMVFAERGFDKATVREICTRAEMNVGAVNYHFGDKMRLYIETILHAHEVVFDQVPLPEWSSETPPQTKLSDFIRTMLLRMLLVQKLPWQAQLMMREFVTPTEACRELAERYIRPHHQMLMEILSEMLPADVPEHQKLQISFSIVGQCMFYRMNDPILKTIVPEDQLAEHYVPERLAEHIANFSLAALNQHELFSQQ